MTTRDEAIDGLARRIAEAVTVVVETTVERVTGELEQMRIALIEKIARPEPEAAMDSGSIESPWLTVKEAAAYARRHAETVRKAVVEHARDPRHGLKAYQWKAGATWKIHRDDLERWVRGEPPSRGTRRVPSLR